MIIGIRHSRLSNEAYFSIDTTHNKYLYREKKLELSFELSQIDKVFKVVSPPKHDKRIDLLGFGHFFYWKIVLLDGRTLLISCMLLDVENFYGKTQSQTKQMFPVPHPNLGLRLRI